jgi:tetratricopeptide (TPR) repeat protein
MPPTKPPSSSRPAWTRHHRAAPAPVGWLTAASLALAACGSSRAPAVVAPACPRASGTAGSRGECPSHRAGKLAAEAASALSVDLDRALTLYQQAIEIDPEDATLVMDMAEALARKEDWTEAARMATRAAEMPPQRADRWALVAAYSAHVASRQAEGGQAPWKDSQVAARRCIELDPRRAECHQLLGRALLRAGDERGALVAMNEAARQAPDRLRFRLSLAGLYSLLEEPGRAASVLEDGLQLSTDSDPARVDALVTLGAIYQVDGALERAASTLERAKAADVDGSRVDTLFLLGVVYGQLKPPRTQEAAALLRAFAQRACKGSQAHRYASECERAQSILTTLGSVTP